MVSRLASGCAPVDDAIEDRRAGLDYTRASEIMIARQGKGTIRSELSPQLKSKKTTAVRAWRPAWLPA